MSSRDFFRCGYSSVLCGYFYMFLVAVSWVPSGYSRNFIRLFLLHLCPNRLLLLTPCGYLLEPCSAAILISFGYPCILSGYSCDLLYCFWLSLHPQRLLRTVISGILFGYPCILSGYSCDLLYFFCSSLHPQRLFLWSLVFLLPILASSADIPVISCIAFGYHCILSGYSCDLLYFFCSSLHPQRLFLWSLVFLLPILASSADIPVISCIAFGYPCIFSRAIPVISCIIVLSFCP